MQGEYSSHGKIMNDNHSFRAGLRPPLRWASLLLLAVLSACGGDGGNPAAASADASLLLASGKTVDAPGLKIAEQKATSPKAQEQFDRLMPFHATVTVAPADGATINGTVPLQVAGKSMVRVELLPPTGNAPVLGSFSVSPDGTLASLQFDTGTLPNGVLLSRISAFDQPAGTTANEAVAMPARTWILMNDPEPTVTQIPPASYMPEVRISWNMLPYVDPQPLIVLQQLSDADFTSLLATDWARVESVLRQYIPANVVLYPPTPLGIQGEWSSCLQFHGFIACNDMVSFLIGLMQSKAPA
jgi:hypothetical protein